MNITNNARVTVSEDDVREFKRAFPCSGLADRSYWFEFDHNGNLVDTNLPQEDDGPGAIALVTDARRFFTSSKDAYYQSCVNETAPLRRCEHCEHNLGDVLKALACPLFGKPRHGVEIRCVVFKPKS